MRGAWRCALFDDAYIRFCSLCALGSYLSVCVWGVAIVISTSWIILCAKIDFAHPCGSALPAALPQGSSSLPTRTRWARKFYLQSCNLPSHGGQTLVRLTSFEDCDERALIVSSRCCWARPTQIAAQRIYWCWLSTRTLSLKDQCASTVLTFSRVVIFCASCWSIHYSLLSHPHSVSVRFVCHEFLCL